MYIAAATSCRIFGPAFFTTVYDATGLYILTSVMIGIMLLTALSNLVFYKRLIPYGESHDYNQTGRVEIIDIKELDDEIDEKSTSILTY